MSHSYIDPDTKSADLFLQHVLKPHKQKITAVSFSADGKYLATGSEDQTIFLFRINSQTTNHNGDPVVNFSKTTVTFSPIGFIVLNDPVASISFSPDNHKYVLDLEREEAFTNQFNEDDVKSSSGKNFMFVLSTGLAYTAMVPAVGKYNNTVSFELKAELFNVKKWELEIEEPDIAKVPSKSAEKSVEESVKTEGDGNKDVVTNPKPAQNLDDLPEARRLSITRRDHGLVLQHDSRIHSVIYLEGGYLILSFVNADGEGEIRAMKQGMPGKSRYVTT